MRLSLGLSLFLLASGTSSGLPAGRVTGRVFASNGAPIPAATVTLSERGAGLQFSLRTEADGRFAFVGLPPGDYSVSAAAGGFSLATRTLRLGRGEERAVDLTLSPGTFTESVTVMGTRLAATPETVKRIPGSVEIVDRETLERSRVFDFSEALRKVSGLNVRDEEGFGLRPNIGIRGLSPTRSSKALLLEDGIPLTFAPYGDNASYYHPPVERFESIEVLKGAGQIAYGPVTVGGVINYLTPDPPARPGGSLTLIGGNREYFNGHIAYGTTWGSTGVLLGYTRKQGDGSRENIHSELDDVNLKVTTRLSPSQTLTLRGNYYGEDSQVTYSGLTQAEYEVDPRQNPFQNDSFEGARYGASATHTILFGGNLALTTNLYGSRFERNWWRQSSNSNQRPNDSADPLCGGMQNLDTTCGNEGRLRRYAFWGIEPRLKFSHRLLGLASEAQVGVRAHFEIQNRRQENGETPDARQGVLVEDNERKNKAYSGFAQNRFLLGRWTVTPGLRLERIRFERTNRLANRGAGVSGATRLTQLVPGVGVSYGALDSTTLFAGVHRGFAPPRTEDLIDNRTGGAVELDPELSWNYELGVRSEVTPGLSFHATLFRMDYENQIVPASLAGGVGAALTNGGETLHEGLELSTRLDSGTLFRSLHDLFVRVAYTYLPVAEFRGRRFSNVAGFHGVSVAGNRLPYAPERLLTASAGYEHPSGLTAMLEAVSVSEQFADDLNTREPSENGQRGLIPAYTVWNATVACEVESLHAAFFVAVKNLLDKTYIADRSRGVLPGSPRLVQAGVRVKL